MSTKVLVEGGTHPSRGRFGNSSSVKLGLVPGHTARGAKPLCIHDPEEEEGELKEHDDSEDARCRALLRDRFEFGASRDAERSDGHALLAADGQRGADRRSATTTTQATLGNFASVPSGVRCSRRTRRQDEIGHSVCCPKATRRRGAATTWYGSTFARKPSPVPQKRHSTRRWRRRATRRGSSVLAPPHRRRAWVALRPQISSAALETPTCFLCGARPRRPRHQGVLQAGCLSWRDPTRLQRAPGRW